MVRHIPGALISGIVLCSLVCAGTAVKAPAPASILPESELVKFDRYHTPEELNAAVDAIHQANPNLTAVHRIGRSAGGRDLLILEIGPDVGGKTRRMPAVFVAGNLEGTLPIASEAALFLALRLVASAEARKDLTWYILPAGNPDGSARYFSRPSYADGRNGRPHNDDMDDTDDEDGPDDLDGNGIITEMRVMDPAGEWLPSGEDARLMRRADTAKGEKGIYKLYTEGIDNDGDGEYNEDGPGGTDISVTFPHLFKPFTATGGLWPGSEPETFAIMQFVMDRPEIAMTFTLGASNMCLQPPAGGRKAAFDPNRIRIPERYAKAFGLDPNAVYSMQEIMDFIRPSLPPGVELTEAMVASILGLGAVVNPLEEDLKFYRELSARYKDYLKQNKLDAKRIEPIQPRDGSFELWSYYHLGVPTFSMDFWTPPEAAAERAAKSGITADMLENMSAEEFEALGEEKLGEFLKENNAPDTVKAASLMDGVRSGKMTPKQIADILKKAPKPGEAAGVDPKMKALLAFSDKFLHGKGFIPWTPFKHPTLGDVEIGGAVPYTDGSPPPEMIRGLLEGQVPWILRVAEKLPRLKILKSEATPKGASVYELTVWVHNAGELPFPTAMGKRNRRVGPAVVTVRSEGLVLLSGKSRTVIPDLDALKSIKLTWLIQSEKPRTLFLTLESPNAWGDAAEIRLGGAR